MKASNDADYSVDEAIVKRVQSGDKEAYNILITKYQHRVFSIAYKFVKQQVDANDIAQEAFIKAYKSIQGFRGDCSFYTWLYRIVVNVAKTYIDKSNKYKYDVDIDSDTFSESSISPVYQQNNSPDGLIESEELKKIIFKTLSELPDDLSKAITLREIDGLSYEDIAKILDIPAGTVRSRIFRARQLISEKLSNYYNQR